MRLHLISKPKEFILNDQNCDFLHEYEVHFRICENGHVYIDKVLWFSERFQITKDITVDIIPQTEELEKLRKDISNWYIGYQLEQMNKPREWDNDDWSLNE